MRITGIESIPVALPFREDYVTARGRLTYREIAFVFVTTAGGPTGFGDAVALSLRGGPELTSILAQLEATCRPALDDVDLGRLGDGEVAGEVTFDRARNEIAAALGRCEEASAQARAAIDLALHDLAGKLFNVPVWKLLGAQRAAPVECNGTLVSGPSERVTAQAARLVESGFTTLKLKAGTDADLEAVRAVRAEVGPEIQLRIDANGVWSSKRALAALESLEPVGLQLVEQPTADLDSLAQVRAGARIPIVADESVTTAVQAQRAIELGACDAATLKLAKVGGIGAAMEIAALLPSYLSSALDGPVGIAAAAHLAQALPSQGFAAGLAHGLATAQLFEVEPALTSAVLDGGSLVPPAGAGFGVVLDDAAIEGVRI